MPVWAECSMRVQASEPAAPVFCALPAAAAAAVLVTSASEGTQLLKDLIHILDSRSLQ
jgi:predicted naringenin-chalcone synthase